MIATITHHQPDGTIATNEYPGDEQSWIDWCTSWIHSPNWTTEVIDGIWIFTRGRETVYATLTPNPAGPYA